METEGLDILLKITEIDIKLAELEEKQRKANGKRMRRTRVQWTRDWIMRRTLFGQYENLLAELNRVLVLGPLAGDPLLFLLCWHLCWATAEDNMKPPRSSPAFISRSN